MQGQISSVVSAALGAGLKTIDGKVQAVAPQGRSFLISKECREGKVMGPFDPTIEVFSRVHVSRFGVISKGSSGKWRLILALLSPTGFSVNDGIPPEYCSLSYTFVDEAAQVVGRLGPQCLLAKVNIQSAYHMIPVHPEDRLLLGMVWQRNLFIDAALPFGLRSTARIFTAGVDVLE